MRVRIIQPTIKPQLKKRVCAYARVSTGSELQGESLENQVTYYENLIKSNPEYEFVEVFADRGITGTTDNRPEFQRMIKMARQGKIDLIITKSISRFARNTTVMLETVRELKELNVEVRFEKENINILSGDGELMLTILSSFAEEESKNISQNTKWSMKKKFQKGELVINTKLFLGYDKDEFGDLVINREEAKIVHRIFTDYLAGKGVFTIARELNDEGVPTIKGGKWQETTILQILKNEKYKGDAHLQKYYTPDHLMYKSYKNNGEVDSYYIEGNHAPIISKEMWEKAQEEIVRRAEEKGNIEGDRDKYTKRYPLTGMLYCSKCRFSLRRRTWNSKHKCRKIVWQCSNYIMNGKASCTGTTVDDEIISNLNIDEETVVKEVIKDGKKHYIYTSKNEKHESCREPRATEKENGSILQGVNRPIRTTI
ncbi:recombinase family protein [Tissierella simiarum]|uniref:recombinase family protein n=1 Tax=Tissierella simiarum TaxID=2841534 RepID=UPI001FEA4564|nr:recombinase family protein [Tissierella simiarum]